MLELDHVFCFVEPEAPEVAAIERAGLIVKAPGQHRGQGTAQRSVMFDEEYLELIWLAARADAEVNPMRLDRRADFASTGCSPFGVALRGTLSDAARESFWNYKLAYAPPGHAGLWIHRWHDERPTLPIVFVSEPQEGTPLATLDAMRPRAWPHLPAETRTHACGATGIAHVVVHGTVPRERSVLDEVARVTFTPSETPLLEVVLHAPQPLRVQPCPHLVIRT